MRAGSALMEETMPSNAKGTVRFRNGKWRARVTLDKRRPELILSTCRRTDDSKAQERTELLAGLATRLVEAGRVDVALPILERAASRDGKALADVVTAANRLCSGEAAPVNTLLTFREFAEQWTSGKLAKRFPDHVRSKDRSHDEARLNAYAYPLVGAVPLRDFTLDHADAVMGALPSTLSIATRRHCAQVMARVLSLAVFPGRVIDASPLPKGYLPKLGPRKAMTYLYPDEDRKLLEKTTIDLTHRLMYGTLSREGMRRSDATQLSWRDLDLDRGAIRLDRNKTKDPRLWALDPGVVRALIAYRALRGDPGSEERVFLGVPGIMKDRGGEIVEIFREHLREAGIDRAELFERSDVRQPIRIHDLRATFVTLSLASGRTETWVADRTGHKSSLMINTYRRAARQVAELNLGTLLPLNEAIPELRAADSDRPDVGRDVGRASADAAAVDLRIGPISTGEVGLPRDRIELPTRGFSIPCSTN
jgi:integrase